jgi:hypothetical protein
MTGPRQLNLRCLFRGYSIGSALIVTIASSATVSDLKLMLLKEGMKKFGYDMGDVEVWKTSIALDESFDRVVEDTIFSEETTLSSGAVLSDHFSFHPPPNCLDVVACRECLKIVASVAYGHS